MTKYTEMINEARKNYRYYSFAVRTGRKATVGEILENSYWYNEYDGVYVELDGVCGTEIEDLWFDGDEYDDNQVMEAIERNKVYPGEMQYIIGGRGGEYGNDENEIVIPGAEVICIIEK